MRIAAIYWPTSSVGGINTELRNFRDEAERRGHTFHVLRSGKHSNISATVFSERKLIRGGDTFVTIDGEASHHPKQLDTTLSLLAGYDSVYLAFLCPHPTKDYGDQPVFLELLQGIRMMGVPIVGRITDGYWKDYAEWGEATLKLCKSATFTHPSAAPNWEGNPKVSHGGMPFHPRAQPTDHYRSPTPRTVWTSQWKAIKGIHKLLPCIPDIRGRVDLYSNGILYYQLRETADWKKAVGRDLFKPEFSGDGTATFYGAVPLDDIPGILLRSWFMIDLMGIGKPKNQTYIAGAHNNTTIEAAHYGACPVLHARASSVVPTDIALFASEARDVPKLINSQEGRKFARCPLRRRRALNWVRDNFMVRNLYPRLVLGERP